MGESHHQYLTSTALRRFLSLDDTSRLPAELGLLLDRMERVTYGPGERILREGDRGDTFYVIDAGRVAVISEKDGGLKIGALEEGDFFGELALLTGKPRTATVRAETSTAVFRLAKVDFEEITQRYPAINGTLLNKLYERIKSAYAQLELKNEQLQELNRIRTQLASIFTSVVLLITFYTFVLGFLHTGVVSRHAYAPLIREYASRAIEIITLVIVVRMIRNSHLPIRSFGVTLAGWRRSALESLAVSGVVIAALALAKMAINQHRPGLFRETRVVDFGYFGWSYVTYLLVAPLQEFITRGTVQSTLQRLFVGYGSGFLAVVVTSFLFGSLHVYSSIGLAVSALLTSWLWGWMYHRQQNLVGVSLSHFLIGNMAGLMGYWTFF
jgi:CRP-like cAMP-binding protein